MKILKFVDEYVNNKLQDVDNKFKELGMIDKNGKSSIREMQCFIKMGAIELCKFKIFFDGKNITIGIDSSTGEAKVFNSSSKSNVNGERIMLLVN